MRLTAFLNVESLFLYFSRTAKVICSRLLKTVFGWKRSLEAQYPANTNVLYVDLAAVERIASSRTAASLPGIIMNLKKPTVFYDQHGLKHRSTFCTELSSHHQQDRYMCTDASNCNMYSD